ncbi:MAG TPA: FCD domain-containing protein [Treponemataceae bacterium]|nr:FCD domain-containing protein [Treponemataceae bacterium]
MEFPKLSSPSLKELFVREIESMILSGKLPVGTKLPPERVLAADMQVSRAVVNSGLDEMAKKGFIDVRPRVGAFVADFRRRGTVDTLLSIMRYNGGILRKPEIRAMLEIRLVLEKLAIELAVPKITEAELDRLKALCDRFGSAPDAATAADAVFEFHHELCVISGNTLLPLIFYSFRPPVIGLWERYLTLHGIANLHANTETIWRQLAERDAAGAIATLSESINRTIAGGSSIYFE